MKNSAIRIFFAAYLLPCFLCSLATASGENIDSTVIEDVADLGIPSEASCTETETGEEMAFNHESLGLDDIAAPLEFVSKDEHKVLLIDKVIKEYSGFLRKRIVTIVLNNDLQVSDMEVKFVRVTRSENKFSQRILAEYPENSFQFVESIYHCQL